MSTQIFINPFNFFEFLFPQLKKMRVVVKGGVWKNTEDEILKVAVRGCLPFE